MPSTPDYFRSPAIKAHWLSYPNTKLENLANVIMSSSFTKYQHHHNKPIHHLKMSGPSNDVHLNMPYDDPVPQPSMVGMRTPAYPGVQGPVPTSYYPNQRNEMAHQRNTNYDGQG